MKFEFSAGGIVYKREQGNIYVLVAKHSGYHGWVFPKGLIGDKKEFEGQSKEETALREVEEETGVVGEILRSLTPITYWYVHGGERRRKTVYYFLMRFISGDTSRHDAEMEEVEWLPESKVRDRLTFANEKEVWDEAKQLIIER